MNLIFNKGQDDQLKNKFLGKSIFSIMTGPSFNNEEQYYKNIQQCYTFTIKKIPESHFPTTIWCCMEKPLDIPWKIWEHHTIIKLVTEELWDKGYLQPINKEVTRQVFRSEQINRVNNIYWFRVAAKFVSKEYFTRPEVCWGNVNEHFIDEHKIKGRRSIMLAHFRLLHHLGFRKIYLCGVDFEMKKEQPYSYKREKSDIAVVQNNILYETLNLRLGSLLPHFQTAGLEIYNCNPESKLKLFPFISVKDALDDPCLYRN